MVRQIDHVNVISDATAPCARTLAGALGLPFSSPPRALPMMDLAVLAAGNATIEVQRFGWRLRNAPSAATPRGRLAAIVFDAEDLDSALAELTRRRIPHISPLVVSGAPGRLPAYDCYRPDPGAPHWRVATIDGVLDVPFVSTRRSARAVAGSSPRAARAGRMFGRLAGSRLGRPAAPILTPPDRFVAVVEWGHDVAARRAADRTALTAAQADGLGITGLDEVAVAAPDLEAATGRWTRLLGDPDAGERSWNLGGGPRLRLVPGPREEPARLNFTVASLASARERLAARGLLGVELDGGLAIDPARAAGLDLRLVEAAP